MKDEIGWTLRGIEYYEGDCYYFWGCGQFIALIFAIRFIEYSESEPVGASGFLWLQTLLPISERIATSK